MTTEIKQANDIKYNPVYLSDLKPIIDLYLQQKDAAYTKSSTNYKRPLLTEDFGLPLYIAVSGKQTVACSFVLLNELGEMDFRVLVNHSYNRADIEEHLIKVSKKNYLNKEDTPEQQLLKNSIYKLVSWLNYCD